MDVVAFTVQTQAEALVFTTIGNWGWMTRRQLGRELGMRPLSLRRVLLRLRRSGHIELYQRERRPALDRWMLTRRHRR